MIKIYCPLVFSDLHIFKMKSFLGKEEFYIGTEENDRTMRINGNIQDSISFLISLMDGNNSIEDIQERCEQNGLIIDVQKMVEIFRKNGFLKGEAFESNNEIRIIGTPIFRINFKNKENESAETICKYLVKLFPISIILLLMIIMVSFIENDFSVPLVFDIKKTALIDAVLSNFFMVTHELGHMIYARSKKIKLDCFEIRLRFGIYPTYFLKYKNLYFVDPRVRLRLIMAGVDTHVLFFFVGVVVMMTYSPFLGECIIECNLLFIYYNLLPIYLTDGYYALSTVLNVYNYRISSLKAILNIKFFIKLDIKHKCVAIAYGVLSIVNVAMGLIVLKTVSKSVAYYIPVNENIILSICIVVYVIQLGYMIYRVKWRKEFNFK